MIDDEQLEKSTALAQSVADSELLLEQLENFNAPAKSIKNQRLILERKREEIRSDMIASELLPQARIRARMAEKRRDFLRNRTILGQLFGAALELEHKLAEGIHTDSKSPFNNDKELNEHWAMFVAQVKQLPKAHILVEALSVLLTAVQFDLIYARLPSRPPDFKYDDLTSSSEDVH